jgi:HSP20 family protein
MGFRHDDARGGPAGAGEGPLRVYLERRSLSEEETELPALDIYETAEELVVEAELPGVRVDNIEVTVGPAVLVIEGFKEETIDAGRVNFLCMERSFGAFRRIVPLVAAVDLNSIRARYRAGILQVCIPKVEEKRGQRRVVPVRATDPASEE